MRDSGRKAVRTGMLALALAAGAQALWGEAGAAREQGQAGATGAQGGGPGAGGGRVDGEGSPDFDLTAASVTYVADLDLLVFEQTVAGKAGGTAPRPHGALDGAPVLGYVFPTTLAPQDVGFSPTEGILALAVTSHPDFDDSPLWDENGNGRYDDDGLVYHTHWVVLVKDARAPGGLAVQQFKKADAVTLPPTAPDMPMFMDSPGYAVALRGPTLKVLVPAPRLHGRTGFRFDAVTAFMKVSTAPDRPMLGVEKVFEVLSKDLSLPYSVQRK